MIIKSFEIKIKKFDNINFFLYGNNKGLIEQTIQQNLKPILPKNITNYEENEILNNIDNFISEIQNKSFFEDQKLIIINRASDKIFSLIKEILDKKLSDISIILKAETLDKKSKIRTLLKKINRQSVFPFMRIIIKPYL